MRTFLCFDLGTTLFKAAVFDEAGTLLALHRAAPPVRRDAVGGTWELACPDFVEAIVSLAAHLRGQDPAAWSRVAAVSFASQANSFALLDDASRPITPLILWPDRRAAADWADAEALTQVPDFARTTGVPQLSSEFAIAKLLWLRRHDSALWSRAAKVCFISDCLTLWMTGKHVTEGGLAGLTGLCDIHALDWWPSATSLAGIATSMLPRIVRAGTDVGQLAPAARDALQLAPDCRFVLGCLDQYAGAIGTGTVTPGDVCETTGTVLAVVRCSDELLPSPLPRADVFQGPSFQRGLYFQMCFSNTSANLLAWYRSTLSDAPSFEELSRQAASARRAAAIQPPRDGEPLEASFRLVRPDHTRGEVVRGIMELIAAALADQLNALGGSTVPSRVRSAGGAARSDEWLAIKSHRLRTRVEPTACPEPTCLGAAVLAARATTGEDVRSITDRWIKGRTSATTS
jgi:xylulokinase